MDLTLSLIKDVDLGWYLFCDMHKILETQILRVIVL